MQLMEELQGMRVSALRKRAASARISADLLEDALDADDSKAALIQLIVDDASSRGPAEALLVALQAGGDEASEMVAERRAT